MNDVKLPPNNNEAEESVIGSLLIDGEAIHKVKNIIKSVDFYFEQNRFIYEACENLYQRREAINNVTLAQELDRLGKLETIGGSARLSYLMSVPATSLDIEFYADIVYRLSVARQMIALGDRISSIGYKTDPNVSNSIQDLTHAVNDFKKSVITYNELISPTDAGNVILDMLDESKRPRQVMRWGFRDLDRITYGIYPELVIIGARPSTGKTQLLLDILENVAIQDKKVLFCSAEMSIKALMERKIARELKLDIKLIRSGELNTDVQDKLVNLSGEVSEQQVWYLPHGSSSMNIYDEALKLKENIGLDIVFVDYLQILKDCWQLGKENKATLVGRACKVLKSIVDDLNIPVICASQLNRDIEHRPEEARRPILADLRESGDIEQDSDVVFLLWRDLDNPDEEVRNVLEVKMAKNRQLGDAPAQKLVWVSGKHSYEDMKENY